MKSFWKLPQFGGVKKPSGTLSEFLRRFESQGLAARTVKNAFTNRVAKIGPGFGSPLQNDKYFLNAAVALSTTGQGTTTLPSTSTWTAPFELSAGWVRVKIYNGTGTSPTLTDLLITGSDGTTTVQIAQVHPNSAVTLSTTSWFDEIFPFFVDLTLTSITIKTTLGGTSPAATMDCEVGGVSGVPATST